MKVLVIHNGSTSGLPSGETVVFQSEVAALRERGLEVIDVMPEARSSFERINVFWSRKSYRLVADLIQRHNPDIVHAHGVLPDLTASVFGACRDRGIAVVQTLHNYRWLCVEGGLFYEQKYCDSCLTSGDWNGIARRCSRKSLLVSGLMTANNRLTVKSRKLFSLVDRFIAVSNFVRDVHVKAGFPAEQIVVKYNGIEVDDSPGKSLSPPTVAFVGRLDVAKGSRMFLELPAMMPHVQFRVAGVGPDEDQFRERFSHVDNVELMGRISRSQVRQLIRESTCVLVPSVVPETFGLVAAEALGCGTPVVASAIAGLQELVSQSHGGRCVPPDGDPKGYAEAIESILESEQARSEMGRSGWEFAKASLCMDKTTTELIELYHDVIDCRVRNQPGVPHGV